ncbi:hypothetical protein [Mycolicibacterium murale]|uniref:hypothetical protein n=1 Tax=Mycolicibacterium murale TaxID=182220 RepID=UPI001873D9BC|nr:hypothetical protein [Mycolicibacterium murale]
MVLLPVPQPRGVPGVLDVHLDDRQDGEHRLRRGAVLVGQHGHDGSPRCMGRAGGVRPPPADQPATGDGPCGACACSAPGDPGVGISSEDFLLQLG